MKWNEPSLVEYKFRFGAKRRAALARLGLPRFLKKDREWVCSFQLYGLKGNRIQLARGEDGLQALTIAVTSIRSSLDRLKIVSSNVEPYESIFPKILPTSYGLEFHRSLCELLEAEIKKKERQLSRRRLARRKSI